MLSLPPRHYIVPTTEDTMPSLPLETLYCPHPLFYIVGTLYCPHHETAFPVIQAISQLSRHGWLSTFTNGLP